MQTYGYADYVFGDIVEYTCKTGFYASNKNNQLFCLSSGQWSNNKHLECKPVTCPIELIEHSTYT